MDVLKIFEIFYVGEDKVLKKVLYKWEIVMLRNGEFDLDLLNKI